MCPTWVPEWVQLLIAAGRAAQQSSHLGRPLASSPGTKFPIQGNPPLQFCFVWLLSARLILSLHSNVHTSAYVYIEMHACVTLMYVCKYRCEETIVLVHAKPCFLCTCKHEHEDKRHTPMLTNMCPSFLRKHSSSIIWFLLLYEKSIGSGRQDSVQSPEVPLLKKNSTFETWPSTTRVKLILLIKT